MMADQFGCALCGKQGMTESEALAHECGVDPPEPTLADMPMSTREAVTVLAVQLSGITGVLGVLAETIAACEQKMDKFGQLWEAASAPRTVVNNTTSPTQESSTDE